MLKGFRKRKVRFSNCFFEKRTLPSYPWQRARRKETISSMQSPHGGGDAGVIEIGMAEAFVQQHFRLRAGPGPQTVLPDKLFS